MNPTLLSPAQHDIGRAQAGADGRNTQQEQIAEAPHEGRLGEGSPGRWKQPREASRAPARARSAAVAVNQSAAVAGRQVC